MAKGTNLNAEEWGWGASEGKLEPLQTNLPPAPNFLMKVIRLTVNMVKQAVIPGDALAGSWD